mgnify:FL=1
MRMIKNGTVIDRADLIQDYQSRLDTAIPSAFTTKTFKVSPMALMLGQKKEILEKPYIQAFDKVFSQFQKNAQYYDVSEKDVQEAKDKMIWAHHASLEELQQEKELTDLVNEVMRGFRI